MIVTYIETLIIFFPGKVLKFVYIQIFYSWLEFLIFSLIAVHFLYFVHLLCVETAEQQSGLVHPALPVPTVGPNCPLSARGGPHSLPPRPIQPLRPIQGHTHHKQQYPINAVLHVAHKAYLFKERVPPQQY